MRGVLFDLDGVLIDSPEVHAWAWAEIFRPFGIELPPERLHREEGRRSEEIAAGIVQEYGLKISDSDLIEMLVRKRAIYRTRAPRELRSGARSTIEALVKEGLRIGLVSGSARENVMDVLQGKDERLFGAIVTAEDYTHGKPNPEPYITGCLKLGVEPGISYAVENAPLGIASAKAAGMFVFGLTSTLSAKELQEADMVIEMLEEIISQVTGGC